MDEHYDALIIGAGQAAKPLAIALAEAGRKTAIIEREHIGGTCVNEGCTPTKTMVASARVAALARRGADYGVQTGTLEVDMRQVRQRKRAIIDEFRSGNQRALEQAGVSVLMGEASFKGPRALEVRLKQGGQQTLHAETIIINTGARPARPNLPGLERVPVLDSTSIMELDHVPEHLLVLGGGYIGLEFGQMFRRFGSRVTLVQRGKQLLAREDDDVAAAVAAILREDGIEVLLESEALGVEPAGEGHVQIRVRGPEGERSLRGSHLLAAAGRTPNTDRLNLTAAGVATDRHGYITVNARLQTSAAGIYALGDVKGGPAFTHISYDDYRILKTNLLDGGEATTEGRLVPYTVFIDPQLGRVGLSEQEASAQGRRVRVASMPMRYVARALEVDETRGMMKAIVDADDGQILGFACLGLEGGEIMSMVQLAMLGGLPYTRLRDAIFAHPTLAEALNTLFSQLD
jgi:pyruvate/2-oxoglutarate dehydrogenase complex dihydrolipoamide dehydrogenase (E3) component